VKGVTSRPHYALRVRLRVLLAVLLTAGAVSVAIASVPAKSRSATRITIVRPGHLPAPRSESFISLVPACGCGSHTALDVFSLRNGRLLGTIAKLASPVRVSAPHPGPGGSILLTVSAGPTCGEVSCEKSSCASSVNRLDLNTGAVATLYRVPDSLIVTDAVASPRGGMLAMSGGACGPEVASVIVRDLATGRQWSIGADLPHCTGLGPVSWNPSGTELMFAYAPVIDPRGLPANGAFCTATRPARLAIVAAGHASSSRAWKLITPDRGCSFEAGAFDREGIAAVEGCRHGGPSAPGQNPLGDVYLLQLNAHQHVVARLALHLGWEQGLVTTEPDGRVLISQDQPANEGYPERDWVWEFDGRQLRPIAHYAADDAAQVIAVAW
jgi:hypothetical protein